MRIPAESTLRRHATWVHLHYGFWSVAEHGMTKGNRIKFVAYPDPVQAPLRRRPYRYFWKESLGRYPLEFWSEVLAYHIGSVVGVPVSPCFPAAYAEYENPYSWDPNRFGSLSLSLIEPLADESLIHGGDLLTKVKPDYERVKGKDHSVQLVIRALELELDDISLYHNLFTQLVFDALIGNSDRHQDNWGIRSVFDLKRFDHTLEFLPAFDNGSSLGRELLEEKVERMLRDSKQFEAYISRGKSHIRWDTGRQLDEVTHEELLRRHILTYPASRDYVMNLLTFNESALRRAVKRVASLSREGDIPDQLILSEAREELICRMILIRRDRLANL